MTRKEALNEIKKTMTGFSGHTHIAVWKEGRSFKVDTNIQPDCLDYPEEKSTFDETLLIYQHCCNELDRMDIELISNELKNLFSD